MMPQESIMCLILSIFLKCSRERETTAHFIFPFHFDQTYTFVCKLLITQKAEIHILFYTRDKEEQNSLVNLDSRLGALFRCRRHLRDARFDARY